jgi:hypothetical protein
MVETTLAWGDLIATIPNLYYQLEKPVAVILLLAGALGGAFSIHKGFGRAAGRVIGSIALASLVFGGLSLAHSINYTVNMHSGGGPVMLDTGFLP